MAVFSYTGLNDIALIRFHTLQNKYPARFTSVWHTTGFGGQLTHFPQPRCVLALPTQLAIQHQHGQATCNRLNTWGGGVSLPPDLFPDGNRQHGEISSRYV